MKVNKELDNGQSRFSFIVAAGGGTKEKLHLICRRPVHYREYTDKTFAPGSPKAGAATELVAN